LTFGGGKGSGVGIACGGDLRWWSNMVRLRGVLQVLQGAIRLDTK
jgi:hypothetical protein